MNGLRGKRILVVEDEAIVVMTVEDALLDAGAVVVGPATTLEQAIELAESGACDAALLDINLNGQRSDAVAGILARQKVPFVLATGYGASAMGEDWAEVEVLHKPYRAEEIISGLERAIDRSRS